MPTNTVEKLNPTRAKITITVTPDELKPSITHAYGHIAEQINIPGFRKGKVPPGIIDQRVGKPAVLEHAVQDSLDDFYRKALEETQLRPLGRPDANIVELPNDTDFSGDLVVSIEVDVRPDIVLPELETVNLYVDPVTVTDDDIAEELDRLRARFGTLVPADRPAKSGDFVQIDLVATIDGREVDEANSVSYEIGSGELLEGLDEALDSLSAGETTTFESQLVAGEHSNEDAEISVTVTGVKERELPEADDDFAQIASEFDTLDELKTSLRTELERSHGAMQAVQAREKFVEKMLEVVDIPVPEKMVDEEIHRLLEADNKLDDEDHRAQVSEQVVRGLRAQILLDEIAVKENMQVSQEEFGQYVVYTAGQYGADPNEFVKSLSENGQIPQVLGEIARTKAIAVAVKKATVTDTKGNAIDL